MCVTSFAADLKNTIVGGWDIQHPTYGYRHVLAYQNAPVNLAAGANCMLLHIPSAKALITNQLVDTSKSPNLLYDLLKELQPMEMGRSISRQSEVNHIVEMGIYHVALLNDLSEKAATDALNQIPEPKRPRISPAFFEFYAKTFPKYRLVLACFNNADLKTASAILVHYEPLFPEKIFFPLLEAHDGNLPRIGTEVIGHQTLIFGGHAMAELTPVHKAKYSESLQSFLPQYAGFQSIAGETIPNQDDWLIFENT